MLVGAEDERPYERPPLSKDYLRGEAGRDRVYVHDESFYADHDIELRLGRTAVDMSPWLKEVALDDGERLRYDRLLLATGAEPRRLAIPGAELDGVHYLRSVEDSDALRERLDRGGTVVVVGAGWIGAEVAASARQRGLDVTLVAPTRSRSSGCWAARWAASTATSTPITACACSWGPGWRPSRGTAPSSASAPATGATLECDFVVVGIGVQPRTRLAARAGLAVGDGILVDEHLRTSAPGVFAAGDVAGAQHPFYRRADPRRALGQRPPPGPGRRAQHARRRPGLRLPAVLLLRPVRRRHGVLGLRPHVGPRRLPRRPRQPRVHRLLARRRPRARGHERERLGCRRPDPAAHPRPRARRRLAPCPTPTCRSSSSHPIEGGTAA